MALSDKDPAHFQAESQKDSQQNVEKHDAKTFKNQARLKLHSIFDVAAEQKRRLVFVLSAVLALVLVIAVLMHPNPQPVQHVTSEHAIRIEPNVNAYEAWQANQEVNIHQTARDVEGLQSNVQQQQGQTAELQQSVDKLQQSLISMKTELASVKAQHQSTQEALTREKAARQRLEKDKNAQQDQKSERHHRLNSPQDLLSRSRGKPLTHDGSYAPSQQASLSLSVSTPPIRAHGNKNDPLPLKANPYVGTLPAGSFVKATLLTGLDAGTGQGAQANPYPVSLRVMSNAILPVMGASPLKQYHLKGCFVLGSAYGSLSEERVFIRTTHLSCVDHAGERLVSSNLKGYVVDSDGKAGLRGKLINRQGEKLGMAFLSGFAGGVGNSAASTAGSSSTSALGSVTSYNTTQALGAGAFSGMGQAGGELSDFYIAMAKSIYPIIVVNAGRNVTIDLEEDAPLHWVSETKPFVPDTKKLSPDQALSVLNAKSKTAGGRL